MPVFKFRGFATGDLVDLSVTQETRSDSATVASWAEAQATPITATLSALRTSGTAPMGNIFSVDANSPAARVALSYHDIESVWSFDDPGNFTALGNSPTWGVDRNTAYGPRATHVHASPDTYTVTCTCHDGENPARSEMITVTVNDPNTVFSGSDTAVVSQASDFSGAPPGAAQFTSIAAARSHLSGRASARLLLRAGETFGGGIDISESGGSGRKYYVGRFGAGERPIINIGSDDGVRFNTGGGGSTNFDELIVTGLDIRGPYDPTTATASTTFPSGNGVSFFNASRSAHKTIWDCRITGTNLGVYADGGVNFTTPQRLVYIGNTRIESWANYGVFSGDAGDWGLSGCTIAQPTGTINGRGQGQGYADHGPFRISRAFGVVVVSNCDFVNMNSWSGNDDNRAMQSVFRWNTGNGEDGNGDPVEPELVMDRFRGEGGPFQLYNSVGNDTGGGPPSTKNPAWVVADRVHHVLIDHPTDSPDLPLGGTTMRNAVFVVPDSRAGWSTGLRQFLDSGGIGSNGPGNQDRRSEVYSCAFIDLRRDAYAGNRPLTNTNRPFDLGDIGNFTGKFVGNNILHAPNMVDGAPANDRTPLDTTVRYSLRYDGERWESPTVDTSRAPGNAPSASFAPLAGSSAIGGATGKVSLLDMDGNLRSEVLAGLTRSSPSEGPYEPNIEA